MMFAAVIALNAYSVMVCHVSFHVTWRRRKVAVSLPRGSFAGRTSNRGSGRGKSCGEESIPT